MLKEKAYILGRANALLDLALGAAAYFIAYALRNWVLGPYILPNVLRATTLSDHLPLLVLMPPLAVAFLISNGHYSSRRILRQAEILRRVVISVGEAAVATLVLVFFITKSDLSRGQVLVMSAVLIGLIGLSTLILRRVLMHLRRKGHNYRRVVLVGSAQPLVHMIHILENHPFWGFHIEAILSDDPSDPLDDGEKYGYPVRGNFVRTLDFLWSRHVDEVIFTPALASYTDLAPILEGCEEMGIRTHLALNAFWHRIAQPTLFRFEDTPFITYSPLRPMNSALILKSVIDRVAALAFLLILSPFFLVIALAIRLTSKTEEPVFYGQTRCGLNGRPFTCWKFRSMRVNADKELAGLMSRNEMTGAAFKIRHDPRVTPLGRFLRKFSLDELPQIYNVLCGDMSLVGPRPPLPEEVLKYDRWQRRRLSMKPGITCLWQVSGRNRLPFETWMQLDLQYIDNWSLLLDFRILARTVFVVLTGYGAM
ncbi:sugar transferase [bacterium]|nr:sugar transferase [bacterium]